MAMERLVGDLSSFLNDTNTDKAELARTLSAGLSSWMDTYGDMQLSAQPAIVDSSPARPLQPAGFEIPTVSETLYTQTREALAKEGFTFVVDIEPVSIGQLATDEATSWHFGHVNPSEGMRAIVPQQMEVAVDPKNLRIRTSNSNPTDSQIRMIQDREAALKGRLPEDVRDLISMRMQHASVLAQLDFEYQKRTGKLLFTDWFGRTDDQTSPGRVAGVGRNEPSYWLDVSDWNRGRGSSVVFAFLTVVLPRKL